MAPFPLPLEALFGKAGAYLLYLAIGFGFGYALLLSPDQPLVSMLLVVLAPLFLLGAASLASVEALAAAQGLTLFQTAPA